MIISWMFVNITNSTYIKYLYLIEFFILYLDCLVKNKVAVSKKNENRHQALLN